VSVQAIHAQVGGSRRGTRTLPRISPVYTNPVSSYVFSGHYWVTGGLGGIGQVVVRYIDAIVGNATLGNSVTIIGRSVHSASTRPHSEAWSLATTAMADAGSMSDVRGVLHQGEMDEPSQFLLHMSGVLRVRSSCIAHLARIHERHRHQATSAYCVRRTLAYKASPPLPCAWHWVASALLWRMY
jgi:hypothetical protein